MVRAMRSRKPHSKYPEGEYELSTTPKKKSPVKSTETDAKSVVSKGSKNGLTKGNLKSGGKTLKGTRSVVLRDRTNLHEEPLKVDLLIKQGMGRGIATKSTKSTRNTRSKTTDEKDEEEEAEKTSSVGGTRKKRKLENNSESTSRGDLKPQKENETNDEENDKTIIAPQQSTKIVKKSIKSSSSVKIDPAISKKPTRKRARKADDEEDEITNENGDEKVNSPDSRTPRSFLAIKRSSNNQNVAKKTAKTTKKIVKSTASEENDDEKSVKASSSKLLRKTTRKVVVEREFSNDSGVGTRDIPETDENQESEVETDSVEKTEKLDKRGTSRKITTSKKSEENVASAKKTSLRSSRSKVSEQETKATENLVGGKKFFKSKTSGKTIEKLSPVKRTVTGKRRNIGNARLSVSFRSRQPTLQESFAKQASRKVLRPRKSLKNYCEETMVEKKKGTKTGNEMEDDKKSGPVYKSVEPEEDSVNDKDAIYDFKFDSNDSREKLPKKKRKRNLRKNIATKKAVGTKKTTGSLQPRQNSKVINSKMTTVKTAVEKKNLVERVSIESEKLTESRETEINYFPEEFNEPLESEKIIEQEKKVEKLPKTIENNTKVVEGKKAEPRIIESVELKGNDCLTLTTTPVLAKASEIKKRNYLRPSKQLRTMLNHALLNKSISPITKAIANFDPGSPWRPPVLTNQDFSRVKNIVQSTPQVRNLTTILKNVTEKTANACNIDSRNDKPTENKDDPRILQNLQKLSPSKAIGLAKSPRKFGTVIFHPNNEPNVTTGISDSNKINSKDNDNKSPKIESSTIGIPKLTSTSIETRFAITSSDEIADDFVETMHCSNENPGDKENSLPLVSSSKLSPLKSLNRAPFGNLNNSLSGNVNRSPLKNFDRSPLKSLNRSPLKNLNRSPLKSSTESSSENVIKSPLKNLQKSPLKSFNETSSENVIKSPLKNLQKSPLKDPKKILSMLRAKKIQNENLENLEPRAGTSSQKIVGLYDDSRVLRQSNLDNYLNLDEMPKSTRISTVHGIFDDAHSTPISGRPAKRIIKDSNIENAFGFDVSDEDSEIEISPIKKIIAENPIAKRGFDKNAQKVRNNEEMTKTAVPARLSIGDIKKHLLPTRKKENINKERPVIERIEEEDEEKVESHDKKNERKNARVEKLADPVDFSDTFDLNDKTEKEEESTMEIELFADIEPQHFKQAPRYSYKRKRAVGFHFSDEDEDNENVEPTESHAPKRRKINKAERERAKKMENWAKDLNQTFEEIEHFDLVVE